MVVIVIIGILAAIAIPKLFGMSAKAKASEVGPAAGTWSKLQQAFLVESNNYGTDLKIAYVKPGATEATESKTGTGSFVYETGPNGGLSGDGSTSSICPTTTVCGKKANWTATNPVALGDCKAGVNWQATLDIDKGNPEAGITDPKCEALTPQFGNLR
jgi:type II secretory pathway pseudopilin PulG